MIVGVAVCPGAPFLVDGFATAIARTVPDLLAACGEALDRLPPADRTLLIGSRLIGSRLIGSRLIGSRLIGSGLIGSGLIGSRIIGSSGAAPQVGGQADRPDEDAPTGTGGDSTPVLRVLSPGTEVRTSVTRSDIAGANAVRLPGGSSGRDAGRDGAGRDGAGQDGGVGASGRAGPEPSVAIMVGAHLLRASGHTVPTWGLEVRLDVSHAAEPAELNTDGPDRVTVLVIADGAACHGDNAPGRSDDRADTFDAALAGALASGDPAALGDACRDPQLPADAVMASVDSLALLADLTRTAPPDAADLLYSAHPFGVGYFVASWRWNRA